MKLFINSNKNREYTKVMAPPTTEGEEIYRKKQTPTLVERQNGEAWDIPFTSIYEPFKGDTSSIISVDELYENNLFKGFEVVSKVESKIIKQLIIVQESNDYVFNDKKRALNFTGRYAVITMNENQEPTTIYIGEGIKMTFGDINIMADYQKNMAAYINLENKSPEIKATRNMILRLKNKEDIKYVPSNKLQTNKYQNETY